MDKSNKRIFRKQQIAKKEENNCRGYFQALKDIFSPSIFFLVIAFCIALLFALRFLRNIINECAWSIIVTFVAIALGSVAIAYTKPHKNLFSKSVVYFDLFLLSFFFSFLISVILAFPCLKLLSMASYLPLYVLSVFMFVCLELMVTRFIYVNYYSRHEKKNYYTIGDLLDIYNFPSQKNKCILKDIPVDEDLLHRDYIINRLNSAINGLESGGLIAVHGKWGSGKTTIIKSILESNKSEIPYEILDVWNYSDERALLTSIIDTVYKNLKIGKDSAVIRSYLKKYVTGFLSSTNASFLGNFLDFPPADNSIVDVINDYLSKNDKRVVIVLDNLDRATDEFTLMIYKAIAHVSKLKNVVFICAFDDERTGQILERLNLPRNYLDKLFTITVKVPNPNRYDLYSIANTCLENYFNKYFKNDYLNFDSTDSKIIRLAINCCDNLRTFIVLFNSLSNLLSMNKDKINIVDALAVELFKNASPKLFSLIISNPQMFVVCHRDLLDLDNFNPFASKIQLIDEKKKFVEDYFAFDSPFHKYFDLLGLLFPGFSSFTPGDTISDSIRKRAVKGKRIFSGKYFYMYIEEKETKFELLQEDLVQALTCDDKTSFYKTLDSIFQKRPRSYYPDVLKHIQEMEELTGFQKEYLLWYLLERYYWFGDYSYNGKPSARRIAINIICDILNDPRGGLEKRFFEKYNESSLQHIVLMRRISRELIRRAEQDGEDYDPLLTVRLETNIKKACFEIMETGFLSKMYTREYYDLGLTVVLLQYQKERFLQNIGFGGHNLPNNCYVPIVNDLISTSYDSENVYFEANLNELEKICNLPDLASHLEGSLSKSINEMTVKKVFSTAFAGWNKKTDDDYVPYLKFPVDDPPSFHDDLFDRSELVHMFRNFEN